ncbi:hypothetical protein AC579_2790 [Pseudocercospora musae]|uniref:Uncharacterized protein n=1 Tax=Pseudocercospora musae TaxID=113226 RepID=A0A139HZ83_9PEZI|nr:hypothetical protein AC579_2790 [Pseudocercospora musae]
MYQQSREDVQERVRSDQKAQVRATIYRMLRGKREDTKSRYHFGSIAVCDLPKMRKHIPGSSTPYAPEEEEIVIVEDVIVPSNRVM